MKPITADPSEAGYVYVLRLEDGCWYVGHAMNLRNAIKQHFIKGNRVQWTTRHKPITLQTYMPANIQTKLAITTDLIRLYGLDKVRGSYPFSAEVLPDKAFSFPLGPSNLFFDSFNVNHDINLHTLKYPQPYRRRRLRDTVT